MPYYIASMSVICLMLCVRVVSYSCVKGFFHEVKGVHVNFGLKSSFICTYHYVMEIIYNGIKNQPYSYHCITESTMAWGEGGPPHMIEHE